VIFPAGNKGNFPPTFLPFFAMGCQGDLEI
jgi:hypothetical protein